MVIAVSILLVSLGAFSQTNQVITLWPGGAPGALGNTSNDVPTLTCYWPVAGIATGAGMVILPGGAYSHLSDHEGRDYAIWLNDHGLACFVLKYRLGSSGYHQPAELQDASRAVRMVRANAAQWKIDPARIGIMGSSACGHLASTLATHFDSGSTNTSDPIERQSSRPDLCILCYPLISLVNHTHIESRDNFLGKGASAELREEFSSEKHVTEQTPPCFIWHFADDKRLAVQQSMMFAGALGEARVPFELHVYEHGSHGVGLGGPRGGHPDPKLMLPWTADCLLWLKQRGFAK